MRGGVAGQGARGGLAGIDQDPPDGSIGTADIADGAVTPAKLASVITAATKGGASKHLKAATYNAKGQLTDVTDEDFRNALDYVGPQKTADVATANTITLPETGLITATTGATRIDFITKPTGDAPRLAILIPQTGVLIRHNAGSPPAGTANIQMVQTTTVSPLDFAVGALTAILLAFDGTVWRRVGGFPHWENQALTGNDSNAKVTLNSAVGARLEYTAATTYTCDGTRATATSPILRMTTRLRMDEGTVASANTIALPNNCSTIIITGTTQVNSFTFTANHLEQGCVVWLRFAAALTLKHNAGGAHDFVSKTGLDIVTTAGMQLEFYYDGTDLVEVGR